MFGFVIGMTGFTAVVFIAMAVADYKYDLIEKYRGYDDDFEEEV